MPRVPDGGIDFYAGLRVALIEFAEARFRLDALDKDGHSLREHLEGLLSRARTERKRLEIEADLAVPPFPVELRYLWSAFQRLSARRTSNGFGPMPISWPEISAFQSLSGVQLAPWEIELIEILDGLWLNPTQDDAAD